MSGRKKNIYYELLGFQLKKENGKYFAVCNKCQRGLRNTAAKRLQGHRNNCKLDQDGNACNATYSFNVKAEKSRGPNVFEFEEVMTMDDESVKMEAYENNLNATMFEEGINQRTVLTSTPTLSAADSSQNELSNLKNASIKSSDSNASITESSLPTKSSSAERKKRKLSPQVKSILNCADNLADQEEVEINDALAKLIYGCGLPLAIVESIHFKNFIKKIRPAYADKIPGRKTFSTSLLDTAYFRSITEIQSDIGPYSVLLIDGCKNSSMNAKSIVTMIHNVNGGQAFLHAERLDSESETVEKIPEVIMLSVDKAKTLYLTDIYAVVSESAAAMAQMRKDRRQSLWHCTSTSYFLNLFAKAILNKITTADVMRILREFKKPCFEKYILEIGGTKMKLPSDANLCSYRDAYRCLINNLNYMKHIAQDPYVDNLKKSVEKLIFDEVLINGVNEYITAYDPICDFINKCQSKDFSQADAVNEWINLRLPERFEEILDETRNKALNVYALAAYYLHPIYDNHQLSKEQIDKVNDFLFKNLNADGLVEWDNFRERRNFFKPLFEKNIKKANVFWNIAEMHQPILSKLAKKLLLIPASSAQIQKLTSSWAHVNWPDCNQLTTERAEKLEHLRYSLQISDTADDGCNFESLNV